MWSWHAESFLHVMRAWPTLSAAVLFTVRFESSRRPWWQPLAHDWHDVGNGFSCFAVRKRAGDCVVLVRVSAVTMHISCESISSECVIPVRVCLIPVRV